MTTIAQGIFSHNLDWNYIITGIGAGIAIIIVDVLLKKNSASYSLPPLAVGLGIYLPPTLVMPLVMGAIVSYFVHRYLQNRATEQKLENKEEAVENCNRHGVLFASGLIVGESLMGVIIAIIIVFSVTGGGSDAPLAMVGKEFGPTADWLGLIAFIAMIAILVYRVIRAKFQTN
jgi:putative OPT family oligopeptide transporter